MKIAVWYHVCLFDAQTGIDPDYSISLVTDQMTTFKQSGLQDSAGEIVVCVNGDGMNQAAARALAPKTARFIDHGRDCKGLLRTVNRLREWSLGHPDWLVCFWHNKGVTHAWDQLNTVWRLCMERAVIRQWMQCVRDLNAGCDSVGAHWLTPEQYRGIVHHPFWGGQFFWAKASFLGELPVLPDNPQKRDDWFLSENWIGMGRRPKVKDYAPHWPGIGPCTAHA